MSVQSTSVLAALVGAFLASTAPVYSQEANSGSEQRQFQFNVKKQALRSALAGFSTQTGIDVVGDGALPKGVQVAPLDGKMSAREALERLLSGTNLAYKFSSATSVVIFAGDARSARAQVALPEISVTGQATNPLSTMTPPPPYAGGQVATGSQLGMLGNRSVMDTPFNTTSYTAKRIQDQQARTIKDVLVDDPSVQMTLPSGSSADDSIKIRGFPVSTSDLSYGGLYGMLPYWSVASEIAERVEILKGPSVLLNGMPPFGSIGGTVNVVPKRAGDTPLTQLTTSYNSSSQLGGAVDIGRRFGLNNQFGARFNGVYRDGETSVDTNKEKLALALLGLDYRGERVRFSTDLGYQEQNIRGLVPFASVDTGFPMPVAPDASKNFGQPWTYMDRKDYFGTARGEIDITDQVMLYAAIGAHNHNGKPVALFPNILNADGDYSSTAFKNDLYEKYRTAEAGLRAQVETGPISHSISFAATTITREAGFGSTNRALPISNIYDPIYVSQPRLADPIALKNYEGRVSSIGMADTLSILDKRVQLTVGARQQYVEGNNIAASGATTSSYNEDALSPSVAIVVKPWKNVALYANYIEGLQQGAIVDIQYTNAGQALPPYQSKQKEVGIKIDWGTLTTTFSAFDIAQPSAILDVPTNTLVVGGEQRNRGIEVNVFGEVTKGIRLLGGVMLIDAVMTKTQGGINDGKEANGVPETQVSLGAEWDTPFVTGLTLSSRVIHASSQYYELVEPRRSIPEWTRVDLGARYTFEYAAGKPVTVRFNVENAFDANYWMSAYGGYVAQGSPRAYRLSSTFNF
jgi:iron complex outermembrane receptor protein